MTVPAVPEAGSEMTDWEGILDRDGPAVWRTAYRLLGNRADAEDCFQETFVSALQACRRGAIASPRSMLLRLATARAMDRLRERYRRRAATDELHWSSIEVSRCPPAQRAESAELSIALRQALACLADRQAEAFCLCCLEDWSYAQAAEHFGISVDAVGVLLHRARTRLRELLAENAGVNR